MSESSGVNPGSTDEAFAARYVRSHVTTTVVTAITAVDRRLRSLVHSEATMRGKVGPRREAVRGTAVATDVVRPLIGSLPQSRRSPRRHRCRPGTGRHRR